VDDGLAHALPRDVRFDHRAEARKGAIPFFEEDKTPRRQRRTLSYHLHFQRARAFGIFLDFVLDLLAFAQSLEALCANRRVVDKDILAAIVLRDEPEALRIVEPLHRTGRHPNLLL